MWRTKCWSDADDGVGDDENSADQIGFVGAAMADKEGSDTQRCERKQWVPDSDSAPAVVVKREDADFETAVAGSARCSDYYYYYYYCHDSCLH